MKPGFISEDDFKVMEQRVSKNMNTPEELMQHFADMGKVRGGLSVRMKSGGASRSTVPSGVSVPSPYKSKWEAAYASKLEMEKAAGLIKQWWYEPFSLWLPGKVRFKPDFLVQYPDYPILRFAPMELIEVKGWSRNRRDGITRLKIAAALFPCFVWRMVWMKKGGGFDGEYI